MTRVIYNDKEKLIYIFLKDSDTQEFIKSRVNIAIGVYLDMNVFDRPIGLEIALDDPVQDGTEVLKKHFA